MRHLPEAWLRTTSQVGARGDVADVGADLLRRYAESHRRYHGLAHLSDVLRRIDELAHHADRIDNVRLAAWFHDAIYDTGSDDNEERSAELATVALTNLRVGDDVVAEVARLVRLTAAHSAAADDPDGAVLCDADLAILAAPAERYQRYVEAVRAEYVLLDDLTFAHGRSEVRLHLLARQRLFSTPAGRSAWEAPARENVTREIASLRGPGR